MRQKSQPEISPSPLCATEGEARQTDASASIAAILEKHKEGMSNNAIAKLFNIKCHKTVGQVVEASLGKNPESGKIPTPEVSTSAVPMASTEDRSESREDARS